MERAGIVNARTPGNVLEKKLGWVTTTITTANKIIAIPRNTKNLIVFPPGSAERFERGEELGASSGRMGVRTSASLPVLVEEKPCKHQRQTNRAAHRAVQP